ncbi:MAG: PaaI family thioesterase [Rhodovibrionaceae bacterium]
MEDDLPSGFRSLVGYRVIEWREGYAKVEMEVGAKHMNRSGLLHGGALVTLIDAACGYAGTYSPDPERPVRGFTLQLSTQFLATVKQGATLTAEARKNGGGAKIFYALCEVRNQEGTPVGAGQGAFRYRRSQVR